MLPTNLKIDALDELFILSENNACECVVVDENMYTHEFWSHVCGGGAAASYPNIKQKQLLLQTIYIYLKTSHFIYSIFEQQF